MENQLTNQILRAFVVIAAFAASILLIYFSIPLLYPFLIGWVFAFLMQPLIRMLERRVKMPRWLTITVSLLLIIGAAGGLVTLLVARIGKEMQRLAAYITNNYEEWLMNVSNLINSDKLRTWTEPILQLFNDNQEPAGTAFGAAGQNVVRFVATMIENLGQTMINFLTALPNVALGLLVAVIAAFFIAKDWEMLRTWTFSRMPEQAKQLTRAVRLDMQKALFGFVRAQLILISITTVLVIIGLLLLRAPYAIVIGLLIGLVDLMPYLGTGAVFVPWIIFVFIDGNFAFGIGLIVLYAVLVIGRHLAEPKIYSSSLGLNPLITLMGIFVGLKLFGFIGLIIGPVAILVILSLQRAGLFRDIRRFIMTGKYLP